MNPYYQNEDFTLYNGDSAEVLKRLQADSVDLTVTSPPYDNLRQYNGFAFDFETVAKEIYRVTKTGGVVVWVVNDATVNGSETGTSFKQALFFMQCGFRLHDTMIYAKKNPIPQNHNRYEQVFEYMFVFAKGKPTTFNPLVEESKNAGKVFDWGNRKTNMDVNQCRRHRGTELRTVNATKRKGNIFYYSIGGGKTGHPAVFPEQLAKDHILSWSNEGNTVLDPFMGSGTTALAAMQTCRKCVGVEISTQYCEIVTRRVKNQKEQTK